MMGSVFRPCLHIGSWEEPFSIEIWVSPSYHLTVCETGALKRQRLFKLRVSEKRAFGGSTLEVLVEK